MQTVSVIIPTFNSARFIGQAIESALAQTEVEIEVIVVDDGSTDDTPRVLGEFKSQIQVIRQANQGQHIARNRAAREARGEWLAFLDADDEWLPGKLAKQLARNVANADLCFTHRVNFGQTGRVDLHPPLPTAAFFANPFETLLLNNPVTTSSVILRKRVFDRLGSFDEHRGASCEDWDLWLRYAHAGGQFGFVAEPLTRYRLHPDSSSKQIERIGRMRLEVLGEALKTDRGRRVPRAVVRRAYAAVWQSAGWDAAPTSRRKALAAYFKSLYYCPADLLAYKGMAKCLLGRT